MALAGVLHARQHVAGQLGPDSIVRVAADDERVECAKLTFDLPVGADWKVLAQTGSGMKAGYAWLPVGSGQTVAWYTLIHDGERTYGFGVKVQPRAMCAWRVEPG